MISLGTQNENVYFQDIRIEHLPQIQDWYNKANEYKFATGVDAFVDTECIRGKFQEIYESDHEFFSGIYKQGHEKMIGLIKGIVEHKYKDSAWISMIVIDKEFQNKGLGSAAIRLLLCTLKIKFKIRNVYLTVYEKNNLGELFWERMGFSPVGMVHHDFELQKEKQEVIVMHKIL